MSVNFPLLIICTNLYQAFGSAGIVLDLVCGWYPFHTEIIHLNVKADD